MPWERWYYDQRRSLARYVHPEARKWLRVSPDVNWNDLNRDADGRRRLAQALYEALRRHGINYTPEKYDPEKPLGQIVRTLNEVLHGPQPEGTCLDLTLAFCGLCLSCELIPVGVGREGPRLCCGLPDAWSA